VAVAGGAACQQGASAPTASTRAGPTPLQRVALPHGTSARAFKLRRLPARARAPCLRSRRLRPACPRNVPVATSAAQVLLCVRGRKGCLSREFDGFDFLSGAVNETNPQANCPPALVHVTLYAGALGGARGYDSGGRSAFPFDWPTGRPQWRQVGAHDLVLGVMKNAIVLWRGTWYGKTGQLVLAPSGEYGGETAGHLIFRWSSHGTSYALSLHACSQIRRSLATLKLVVGSAGS
jgi:hypothetical protein